jgi:hypothetical protein
MVYRTARKGRYGVHSKPRAKPIFPASNKIPAFFSDLVAQIPVNCRSSRPSLFDGWYSTMPWQHLASIRRKWADGLPELTVIPQPPGTLTPTKP